MYVIDTGGSKNRKFKHIFFYLVFIIYLNNNLILTFIAYILHMTSYTLGLLFGYFTINWSTSKQYHYFHTHCSLSLLSYYICNFIF